MQTPKIKYEHITEVSRIENVKDFWKDFELDAAIHGICITCSTPIYIAKTASFWKKLKVFCKNVIWLWRLTWSK